MRKAVRPNRAARPCRLLDQLAGAGEARRTDSQDETLWNAGRDHSGLILAVRMTFAHFSVSSAMNLVKSAAEPPNAMPPSSASRAFGKRRINPVVELIKNLRGRGLGKANAVPRTRIIPRYEFAHTRHFRKPFPSRSGRHSERTQLVAPDVTDRAGHGGE